MITYDFWKGNVNFVTIVTITYLTRAIGWHVLAAPRGGGGCNLIFDLNTIILGIIIIFDSFSIRCNNRLNEYTCEVVAAGSGPRAWATPPRALHRVRKACGFGGGHAEASRLEVPASTGICGGQAWSYSIGGSGAAQVVPRGLRGSKKRIRAGGKGCQRGAQATPKAPKTSRSSLRRQCPLVGARTRAGKGAISSQKGARVSQKES